MKGSAFTVGVEEEYQLVHPDGYALKGRAPELLLNGEPAREEYQRTMVEVATPVCANALEAVRRIRERRAQVARLAAQHGLVIAASGLHPVGPYPAEQVSDVAHYRRIAEEGGAPMRELHIFGMHVHVAVPDAEAAVRAMCGAAPYIPHLLAPSCSSPFHKAEDTGFESFRTMLRGMWPRVGPPLPVATAGEYTRLVRMLDSENLPAGESPIAWDIRPSQRFPTVEFRFFDACPSLETAALLIAMARALTVMYHDRPPPQPSGLEQQLLLENRWRAARYGLDARFFRLDPLTGEERSARDSIAALIDRLGPIAERIGDGPILASAARVLQQGTAAAAMRRVFEETGSYPEVARWVVERTMEGIAAEPETPRGDVGGDVRGDVGGDIAGAKAA
ncbi:MAG: YbdK family carboxylate-amine ligase [Gemmatimonadota bacterium]